MCNFITATLPAGADSPALRAAVDAAGLRFAPLENRHIQRQLAPKESYFHATRAHCDCVSGLGGGLTPTQVNDQLEKLRAKGWSEAKITAWQRTQGPRPKPRQKIEATGELTHDDWLAFLGSALSLRHVRYVGLLQHWYRSSTEDEQFDIQRERRPISEVAARAIPWRDNVLYEIVAG